MRDMIYKVLIPPPVTRSQKRVAIIAAAFIDFVQMFTWPISVTPFINTWGDIVAAIALVIICGFRWQFLLIFAFEAIPVVCLFPTWSAVAIFIPVKSEEAPKLEPVKEYTLVPPAALPEGNDQPQMNADARR